MGHEWIFDVLADLRAYAEQNDLPDIARKTEELIAVARDEIAGHAPAGDGDTPSGRMN
ncbi:hypothetical protein [Paragemmobacter straminiformis]|uniref:Uncharacterized protein n=1 Tax=Paragemmobacter straminiformis TaxID=2045119 RepID=A0A842I2Y8_9RHOB|nr:hypothetical protein [Gemmobacter straminiformis]MBC2834270.1 hypothetical protein [Gemmobacter straminiformis]